MFGVYVAVRSHKRLFKVFLLSFPPCKPNTSKTNKVHSEVLKEMLLDAETSPHGDQLPPSQKDEPVYPSTSQHMQSGAEPLEPTSQDATIRG